jgi:hypothetical protein
MHFAQAEIEEQISKVVAGQDSAGVKRNKQSFLSMDNLDIDEDEEKSFAIHNDDPKESSGSEQLQDLEE